MNTEEILMAISVASLAVVLMFANPFDSTTDASQTSRAAFVEDNFIVMYT